METLGLPTTEAAGGSDDGQLACPRCGYDQRGGYEMLTASRLESWPVRARCPECGVEYWWGDVLTARLVTLRGFVEHARGVGEWCRWSVRTWLWCCWPPVFWSRVRLEHRPRNGRAVLWFLGLMAVLHVLGIMAVAWFWMMRGVVSGIPPTPKHYVEWLIWSITHPFGGLSITLADPWYARPLEWSWQSHLEHFPWWGFPLMASGITFAAMLLVLRATRREMRVTAGHVVRTIVYWQAMVIALWMGWVVPTVLGAVAHIVLDDAAYRALQAVEERIGSLWPQTVLIAGPWTAWWFWCALSIGWRVERAGRIAVVLLVPAILVGATVLLGQEFLLGVRPVWR